MPDPSPTTPPGLLLATDLSARCDRPLERGRQPADAFPVSLVALTVFDTPQAPGDVLPWQGGNAGRERAPAAAILAAGLTLPDTLAITGASPHDTRIDLLPGAGAERPARHVVDNGIDLAILGLHEESAPMRRLAGSRSEQLLQEVACDALLVRPGEQNEKT